jgi:hypothetical protein
MYKWQKQFGSTTVDDDKKEESDGKQLVGIRCECLAQIHGSHDEAPDASPNLRNSALLHPLMLKKYGPARQHANAVFAKGY